MSKACPDPLAMQLEYPLTARTRSPQWLGNSPTFTGACMLIEVYSPVILQGYDVVTVLRPDPNVTASYWWSTRVLSVRSAGRCDPVSLFKNMVFSTNSSLFSYEIRSTFDANKQNKVGASSYMSNPLSSCTVDSVLLTTDFASRTLKFDTPIFCVGMELPFSLSLISTFSLAQYNPYYDDLATYYIQNKPTLSGLGSGLRHIQRNTSSPNNIIGILDAVSSDLFAALYIVGNTSTDAAPTMISTGGFLSCPEGENAICEQEEKTMMVAAAELSYPNGSYVITQGIGTFLTPIQQSFLNMFTVLRDAYHVDFGNIQTSNTLLDMKAFSARIHPDPIVSSVSSLTRFNSCSWGLGCINGTTWVEELLSSNPELVVAVPSISPAGDAPAVAKIDYLCPQFKIKSPGSLITSVFIGTWSMYTALLGIFGFAGPTLEKWYGRKRNSVVHGYEDIGSDHGNPLVLLSRNDPRSHGAGSLDQGDSNEQ